MLHVKVAVIETCWCFVYMVLSFTSCSRESRAGSLQTVHWDMDSETLYYRPLDLLWKEEFILCFVTSYEMFFNNETLDIGNISYDSAVLKRQVVFNMVSLVS